VRHARDHHVGEDPSSPEDVFDYFAGSGTRSPNASRRRARTAGGWHDLLRAAQDVRTDEPPVHGVRAGPAVGAARQGPGRAIHPCGGLRPLGRGTELTSHMQFEPVGFMKLLASLMGSMMGRSRPVPGTAPTRFILRIVRDGSPSSGSAYARPARSKSRVSSSCDGPCPVEELRNDGGDLGRDHVPSPFAPGVGKPSDPRNCPPTSDTRSPPPAVADHSRGANGLVISGHKPKRRVRDEGMSETGHGRDERSRAKPPGRQVGHLPAAWVVGPRGLEPRTCGLRVWSEGAGQSAACHLSWVFASLEYPSFPIVSRSFTGMRRDRTAAVAVISITHRAWGACC
jgi:hypothetical protein